MHPTKRSPAPLALPVLILRAPVVAIILMASVRGTWWYRGSKGRVRHRRISSVFTMIITYLETMRLVMKKSTVTRHTRHSVSFLFPFLFFDFILSSSWTRKRGRQHRWSVKMREPIRIWKSIGRRTVSLMLRLTSHILIHFEFRGCDRLSVVTIIVLILVLGLSLYLKHLRRFWSLDFDCDASVRVAGVSVGRDVGLHGEILRRLDPFRVPFAATHARLLHPRDIHAPRIFDNLIARLKRGTCYPARIIHRERIGPYWETMILGKTVCAMYTNSRRVRS